MPDCSQCPIFLLVRSIFSNDPYHFDDRVILMIKEIVSIQAGISVADLESRSRKKNIVRARKLAMARCREFDIPFEVIGQAFKRSHSTVINAIKPLSTFRRTVS